MDSGVDVEEDLRKHHVAFVPGIFAEAQDLLIEMRDAIELTDFFATEAASREKAHVVSDFNRNSESVFCGNQKLLRERFESIPQILDVPALTFKEVPLVGLAVKSLLENNECFQSLMRKWFPSPTRTYLGFCRPSQDANSRRRTEWLWHQDKVFQAGDDLTLWVPLSPCGSDAPSIEFLLLPESTDLPVDVNGWSIREDELLKLEPSAMSRFAPEFRLGDAVFFDGNVVHRTRASPSMQNVRTSFDVRIGVSDTRNR